MFIFCLHGNLMQQITGGVCAVSCITYCSMIDENASIYITVYVFLSLTAGYHNLDIPFIMAKWVLGSTSFGVIRCVTKDHVVQPVFFTFVSLCSKRAIPFHVLPPYKFRYYWSAKKGKLY